jgi:hypothetical protein
LLLMPLPFTPFEFQSIKLRASESGGGGGVVSRSSE